MITEGKYGTYTCFGFLMISPHVTESRQDSNHCMCQWNLGSFSIISGIPDSTSKIF